MTVFLICCSKIVGSWQLLICIRSPQPRRPRHFGAGASSPGACPMRLSFLMDPLWALKICSHVNVGQINTGMLCAHKHRVRGGHISQYHPASEDAYHFCLCRPPQTDGPSPHFNGLPKLVIDWGNDFFLECFLCKFSCSLRVELFGWDLCALWPSIGHPPPALVSGQWDLVYN